MNQKALNDALRLRKARGLDLTIVIEGEDEGGEKEKQEQKELGLAPDATPIKDEESGEEVPMQPMMGQAQPNAALDQAVIEEMLAKGPTGKGVLANRSKVRQDLSK